MARTAASLLRAALVLSAVAGCSGMPERPDAIPASTGDATPAAIAGSYADRGEAYASTGAPLGPVSLAKLLLGDDPAVAAADTVAVLAPAPDALVVRPERDGRTLATRRFSEYGWRKAWSWDAAALGQPYYPVNGFIEIDRGAAHGGAAGVGMYASGEGCLLAKGADGSLVVLRQAVALAMVAVVPYAARQDAWIRFPAAGPRAAPDDDVVAINVLVEPDAAMTRAAIAANARLRERAPAGFALGAGHAPHLTVLQRYVRRADLWKIGEAVDAATRSSRVMDAEFAATGLQATTFAGAGMAAIAVAPAPALSALQDELVRVLAPFSVPSAGATAFLPEDGGAISEATVEYVRDFVPNASGAGYRPHVTVGVGDPAVVRDLADEPFAPLRFRAAAVAIWQLGDFGTARRRLWSSAGG